VKVLSPFSGRCISAWFWEHLVMKMSKCVELLGHFDIFKKSLEILVLDNLPLFIKRKIMTREYSGEALEQRIRTRIFGGFKMFKLLWNMSAEKSILKVGDKLPDDIKIYDLERKINVAIGQLGRWL